MFVGVPIETNALGLTFSVGKVWKGKATNPFTFHSSIYRTRPENPDRESFINSCALLFEIGKQYLIYADVENGKLFVSKCSRTRLLENASEDFVELDRLVPRAKSHAVDVRLVTDEPEAVLAILAKKKANEPVNESDWQRVFQSEGYVRLKARETSLKRSFEDADFKTFMLSTQLSERAPALQETLNRWKRANINGAARLALAYLPKSALIKAKIYPVIKPRDNSFVFDVKNDPAIFLYIDPTTTPEKFENTLAHELHHIGYSSSCPSKKASDEIAKLPANAQTVINWIGAFGEGFAMLAAAGGPDKHPHAVSDIEDRTRWDRDVANFNPDLKKVEQFFLGILENKLVGDEVQKLAFSFFGIQGPWYTVGWKMSVVIENAYGRSKLIECFCDQRKLLATYNQAAAKYNRRSNAPLALWSEAVLKQIQPQAINR